MLISSERSFQRAESRRLEVFKSLRRIREASRDVLHHFPCWEVALFNKQGSLSFCRESRESTNLDARASYFLQLLDSAQTGPLTIRNIFSVRDTNSTAVNALAFSRMQCKSLSTIWASFRTFAIAFRTLHSLSIGVNIAVSLEHFPVVQRIREFVVNLLQTMSLGCTSKLKWARA